MVVHILETQKHYPLEAKTKMLFKEKIERYKIPFNHDNDLDKKMRSMAVLAGIPETLFDEKNIQYQTEKVIVKTDDLLEAAKTKSE